MTPGPFELSQKIAGNIYGGYKGGQQASALDQILQEAADSDDPKNIDKVISQVLSRVAPEKQQMAIALLNSKKQELIDRDLGAPPGIGSASKPVQEAWIAGQKPVKQDQSEADRERSRVALEKQGFDPDLADLPPAIANKIITDRIKESTDKEAKQVKQEITQRSFDRLVDLIPEVGTVATTTKSPFSSKTREAIGEFDSLTGALESQLIELVNKGILSNVRFKYITEQLLPKSRDTQARIRGKMKAIAIELGLDAKKLGADEPPKGKLTKDQKEERPDLGVFNL